MVTVLLLVVLAGAPAPPGSGCGGGSPRLLQRGSRWRRCRTRIAGDLREQRWDEALRELEQVLATPVLPAEVRAAAMLQRERAERERQAERTLMRMTAQVSDKDHKGVVAAFRGFPKDRCINPGRGRCTSAAFRVRQGAPGAGPRSPEGGGAGRRRRTSARILELSRGTSRRSGPAGSSARRGMTYSGPIWADLPRPVLPPEPESGVIPQRQPVQPGQQQPWCRMRPTPPAPVPPPVQKRPPVVQAPPAAQPTEEIASASCARRRGRSARGTTARRSPWLRPLTAMPSTSRTAWTILCTAACKSGDHDLARQAYSAAMRTRGSACPSCARSRASTCSPAQTEGGASWGSWGLLPHWTRAAWGEGPPGQSGVQGSP